MDKIISKEFDDFVKRQKPFSTTEQPIDWDRERNDWIAYLELLYKQIEAFLKKYKDEGSIRIEYKEIELNEEHVGRYVVKQMVLHIGRQEITLTPIGTLLIGFKGRVDVAGSAGEARLALVDKDAVDARLLVRVKVTVGPQKPPEPEEETKKNIEWVWKIVSSPPLVRFIELNAESFLQLIMEVGNA
jgi:hypothetical protein